MTRGGEAAKVVDPAAALERARQAFLSRAFGSAARIADAALAALGGAEARLAVAGRPATEEAPPVSGSGDRVASPGGVARTRIAALHGVLAAALLAEHRPIVALSPCERARALLPEASWPSRLHALALSALGRAEEAIAAAEAAVALAPDDAWALDAVARAHLAAGHAAEARRAALEAVRRSPCDPDLVRRAGDAFLAEDPRAAEARYRAALALSPGSAEVWDALAHVLGRQGRDADASAATARAASIDPAFAERYRRRRAFLPLFQLGLGLFLAVLVLGILPRAFPQALSPAFQAALWFAALLVPVLFALGAAIALQRGPRRPAPPDSQLADVVRRL